jgi:hypothetical protein
MELPLSLRNGAALVRGSTRADCNRVALTLAEGLGDNYCWIEVRDPDDPPSELDPSATGEIPPDRITFVRKETLRPSQPEETLALWAAVREDPLSEELSQVTGFLRLPQLVQEALNRRPRRPFNTLVIANADRIEEFYAVDPLLIRAFFNLFRSLKLGFIATSTRAEKVESGLFDFLLRVSEDSTQFEVEKGDEAWPEGTVVPLPAVGSEHRIKLPPLLHPELV